MHAPDDVRADALTVPAADAEAVIRMMKRHLSGERVCHVCGYAADVSRWGYRAHDLPDSSHVVLTACCPACESLVRLRRESVASE